MLELRPTCEHCNTPLAAYVVVASVRGEVYAKAGVWGGIVDRVTSPRYFWTLVCLYSGLALVRVTVY
jgi:hypothetical protein